MTRIGNTSPALREFFRLNLGRWAEFYTTKSIHSVIYQQRHATAVQYAEALNLPPESLVLDAGCGPGFTSIALAETGCLIHALDFLPEMAAATRERSLQAGFGDRVLPSAGDVTNLPFEDGAFDLVVMLGVTEWVPPLETLVAEAARVLKWGGYLIIAWNNRWGLHLIVDPAANPVFRHLRRSARDYLERRGWIAPALREYRYSVKDFKGAFQRHSLALLRARGIGFGPLSVLSFRLPDRLGHWINARLQQYADTCNPLLYSVARNYVAIARKSHNT